MSRKWLIVTIVTVSLIILVGIGITTAPTKIQGNWEKPEDKFTVKEGKTLHIAIQIFPAYAVARVDITMLLKGDDPNKKWRIPIHGSINPFTETFEADWTPPSGHIGSMEISVNVVGWNTTNNQNQVGGSRDGVIQAA